MKPTLQALTVQVQEMHQELHTLLHVLIAEEKLSKQEAAELKAIFAEMKKGKRTRLETL